MRIVSWNCNGGLRKKLEKLLSLEADIHIIQECEDPQHCVDKKYRAFAENFLWVGKTKHKGLGIFARKDLKLSALGWESGNLELFLPCTIDNRITLLAVWTRQANSPTFQYIGQAWKYLQEHKSKLPLTRTIIGGDFNSNACWDKWDRWWNHSDVVRELKEIGIHSLYHYLTKELQGTETQPTFFMYRKEQRPYHIDYIFQSEDLVSESTIKIGEPNEWLEFSDHMPIICEMP